MTSDGDDDGAPLGFIQTPPWNPQTYEFLVVNQNLQHELLPPQSSAATLPAQPPQQQQQPPPKSLWPRVLTPGMRSFAAQAAADGAWRTGDVLGGAAAADPLQPSTSSGNPWCFVEDRFLSRPMQTPQLTVHLGGQVDMRRAFSDRELAALVTRLCDMLEAGVPLAPVLASVRRRMQEVYRVAWGTAQMRRLLAFADNLMLLDDAHDVFFSVARLHQVLLSSSSQGSSISTTSASADTTGSVPPTTYSDETLAQVSGYLRATALELWHRYQNQLWADVPESKELLHTAKMAFFTTTSGLLRLVALNFSAEVQSLRASQGGDGSTPASNLTSNSNSNSSVPLFSASSWKTLEDALAPPSAVAAAAAAKGNKTTPAVVRHVVLLLPGDLMALHTAYPPLQSETVRLLQRVCAWKAADLDRDVTLDMVAEQPRVFCFDSLRPERRYVFRFEVGYPLVRDVLPPWLGRS